MVRSAFRRQASVQTGLVVVSVAGANLSFLRSFAFQAQRKNSLASMAPGTWKANFREKLISMA